MCLQILGVKLEEALEEVGGRFLSFLSSKEARHLTCAVSMMENVVCTDYAFSD